MDEYGKVMLPNDVYLSYPVYYLKKPATLIPVWEKLNPGNKTYIPKDIVNLIHKYVPDYECDEVPKQHEYFGKYRLVSIHTPSGCHGVVQFDIYALNDDTLYSMIVSLYELSKIHKLTRSNVNDRILWNNRRSANWSDNLIHQCHRYDWKIVRKFGCKRWTASFIVTSTAIFESIINLFFSSRREYLWPILEHIIPS